MKQRFKENLWLDRLITWFVMTWIRFVYWRPFIRRTRNPERYQNRVLHSILRKNSKTKFGQEAEFSRIHTIDEFRQSVPIQQYEDLEPLIQQQCQTDDPILHADKVEFYARSSGTTGRPKDIPVTTTALKQYRMQQRLLSYYQYTICPKAFTGKALGIVSPAREGEIVTGRYFGAVSGYIYQSMPSLIKRRYLIPAEVFDIADYDMRYRVIIRLAMAEKNITYLGTANPSSLLRLREVMNSEWGILLQSLGDGILPGMDSLTESMQKILQARIRPEPERYNELLQVNTKCPIEFRDIWPSIKLLTTWSSGNCGIAFAQVRASLPAKARHVELGYIASELRGTLTSDPASNAGLPLLDQVFYEFIEKEEWDKGSRTALCLHELEAGKQYYIIVTSFNGLYRYFINDLVTVTGYKFKTPLLKFVQKGKGVTSITGEKVYESQVNAAIEYAVKRQDYTTHFHMTIANALQARYEIYLDLESALPINIFTLARDIDEYLAQLNLEYRAKRQSGRLGSPHVYLLTSDIAEAYKRYQLAKGQREGQYKLVTLLDKNEFDFQISRYLANVEEKIRNVAY